MHFVSIAFCLSVNGRRLAAFYMGQRLHGQCALVAKPDTCLSRFIRGYGHCVLGWIE